MTPSKPFKFNCWALCILFFVFEDVSAFASSKVELRQVRNLVFELSAYQASSPLDYRDNEDAGDIASAAISQATAAQTANVRTPRSATKDESQGCVSMPLIRSIWLTQAAIFLTATAAIASVSFLSSGEMGLANLHWNGSPDFHSFFDWNVNQIRMMEGFLAAIPMVFLGSKVEKSDWRDASYVNFSTTNMVISLFGRRKSQYDPEATRSSTVMFLAAAVALSTGISEEIVFRGYIPSGLESVFHSVPIAALGQAALFALAHISPRSSSGENRIVGGLQFVNSLWYATIYTISGGDILPCIIAHTLYDMHVLCETWSSVNCQMDYTHRAFQVELDEKEEQAIKSLQEEAGPSLSNETLSFVRRFFYAFDYEHKGSLSISDVQRAVTYAFLKDEAIPRQEDVEEVFGQVLETRDSNSDHPGDRIGIAEFLRLLFFLKSSGMVAS